MKENLDIRNGKLQLSEDFVVENKVAPQNRGFALSESFNNTPAVLIPKIEAIHAGATKNKVRYASDKLSGDVNLRSGVFSWTHPYPKPMIKNHDTDTEPLGRITNAQFVTDSMTGRSAIVVMPVITDQDAIQKILDGRYLTVSIGAETDAAICNICGNDNVNDEWCGHFRGEKYEVKGKGLVECIWDAGNLWFHELSFVNVPADQEAQVVATGDVMTMECYMQDGKSTLNLQQSMGSRGFVMTKESAAVEGIITENLPVGAAKNKPQKGGTGALKTPEQLTEELNTKETELKEANEKLASAADKLQESTAQLEEKTNEVNALTEKVQALESEIASLNEKVQTLEGNLEEAKAEKETLVTENTDMAGQIHKGLAERVVDMKVALGKVTVEEKEAAVSDHAERSADSLKDSLADLQKEFVATPSKFVAQQVKPPGHIGDKDNQGTVVEDDKTVDKGQQEEITPERVFYGLLNSNKRK